MATGPAARAVSFVPFLSAVLACALLPAPAAAEARPQAASGLRAHGHSRLDDAQADGAIGAGRSVFRQAEEAPRGTISIAGPETIPLGRSATLVASFTLANAPQADAYITWTLDGRIMGNQGALLVQGTSPGEREAVAELWLYRQPQPVRLARAIHTLWVTAPTPPATVEPAPAGAGGSTGSPGAKPGRRSADDTLAEYRSLYPAYVQHQYPRSTIDMRANATPFGTNLYQCSYRAWSTIPDGPRKGERTLDGDFTSEFSLASLEGLIPRMKKALGRQ